MARKPDPPARGTYAACRAELAEIEKAIRATQERAQRAIDLVRGAKAHLVEEEHWETLQAREPVALKAKLEAQQQLTAAVRQHAEMLERRMVLLEQLLEARSLGLIKRGELAHPGLEPKLKAGVRKTIRELAAIEYRKRLSSLTAMPNGDQPRSTASSRIDKNQ